jgi:hypothetical protein
MFLHKHDSILPKAQTKLFEHWKVELENGLTNTLENFVTNADDLLPLTLQLYDTVPETQTRMTAYFPPTAQENN